MQTVDATVGWAMHGIGGVVVGTLRGTCFADVALTMGDRIVNAVGNVILPRDAQFANILKPGTATISP